LTEYHSNNHCKYLLKYHVVLVCKFRKPLLIKLGDYVKSIIVNYCSKQRWVLVAVETDRNHIHLMLDLPPDIKVSDVIMLLKQHSTYEVKNLNSYLPKGKLWSSGSFICTTGDASAETIKRYINNQG